MKNQRQLSPLEADNGDPKPNTDSIARGLSFGEKAVGANFNLSGDQNVNLAKGICANAIDQMNDFRNSPSATGEQKRLASIAITEIQGAQMWMVKALTWRD